MSTFFKSIGALASKFTGTKPVFDNLDVLNYIEELSETIHVLSDALRDPKVQGQVSGILKNPRPADDSARAVQAAYKAYFSVLPTSVQMVERNTPLGSLSTALSTGMADLTLIRNSYNELFSADKSADVQLSDVKMSSVMTLGYLEALMDLVSWSIYMLNAALSSGTTSNIAPYQKMLIENEAPKTARMVGEIYNRRRGETFVSAIQSLRNRGRDVYIDTNGYTIDTYADERDYTPFETGMAAGFMRSPMVMAGQFYVQFQKDRIEQMRTMREWVSTKVGLMNLQLANHTDKTSAEYLRLEKIVQNYSNLMNKYDRAIANYEAN